MSLDVYLVVPHQAPQAERIYIRRDGATVEISRKEWDEMYPDREPMVVKEADSGDAEVYWRNITHNLNQMAAACELYEPLWRPEEIGITHAGQLIEPLKDGLATLQTDRERLEAFNPENGWGDYEGLCAFVADYLQACERFPQAEVRVSR